MEEEMPNLDLLDWTGKEKQFIAWIKFDFVMYLQRDMRVFP